MYFLIKMEMLHCFTCTGAILMGYLTVLLKDLVRSFKLQKTQSHLLALSKYAIVIFIFHILLHKG